MGGALLDLVAKGVQDVFLTAKPEVTFFKSVYRRHSNFASDVHELPLDNFNPGGHKEIEVQRIGDLIHEMYLRVGIPDITTEMLGTGTDIKKTKVGWVPRLGHALLKSNELNIGGSKIDRHTSVWYDIYYNLYVSESQGENYRKMIGDVPELTELRGPKTNEPSEVVIPGRDIYIPFRFSFNRFVSLALPAIALQYHQIRLSLNLEQAKKLLCWSGETQPQFSNIKFENCSLLVKYIFLDSLERHRFARMGHEYLFEQLQEPAPSTLSGGVTSGSSTEKYDLSKFNHPCKEFLWATTIGAFNGQGIDQGSNNRSRFLAYSGVGDWKAARDFAALNLAAGMLKADTQTSSFGVTEAVPDGESKTFTITKTVGGSDIEFDLTVVNNSGSEISSGSDVALELKSDALVSKHGEYNLASDLAHVSVTVTVGSSGTTMDPENDVVVNDHSVSLDDISIPLDQWKDNRFTTPSGSSKNPWDVVAIIPGNYGLTLDGRGNPVKSAYLNINGHERVSQLPGSYFNYVQPYEHHTHCRADGINTYSFSLEPETHQPKGSMNMSRIDNSELVITFSDSIRKHRTAKLNFTQDSLFFIFAVNYNILRILGGMAGTAYSN
jgi:hypothetical protein